MRTRALVVAMAFGMGVTCLVSPPATAEMQARRAYDFVDSVGVCTHFGWRKAVYETAFDQMESALSDLGIRYVRQKPGSPLTIKRLAELRDNLGVMLQATVDSPPSDDGDFDARILDAGAVGGFVATAVQGLGAGTFVAFEGPNEYDWSGSKGNNANWAQDLRGYMQQVSQTVKGTPAIASVPVVSPALADSSAVAFEQLGNLSQITDRGNLHAYSGERPLGAVLDRFIGLAQIVNPGQPIVISEYGWQTAMNRWQTHPLTDTARAKYQARALAAIFERPVIERAFIYQLADPFADEGKTKPQMHFGLLDNNLTPTPAYVAVRNVMHLLCDSAGNVGTTPLNASLSGNLQNVHHVLLQKSSGVYDLILWQDVASYEQPKPANRLVARQWTPASQQVTLSFQQPIASVRTFLPTALDGDADGGKRPKASFDTPSSVTLDVPDELLIVEIVPAGNAVPEYPGGCQFTPSGR